MSTARNRILKNAFVLGMVGLIAVRIWRSILDFDA